jgi:hypothetical protein
MNKNNSITASEAASLIKGDLENELQSISADVLQRLQNDGSVASWALISKHFVLKGSQDYVGEWVDGDSIFGQGFRNKPLSEMLEILADSNYGNSNFGLKLNRDGRIFVNKNSD